MGEYEKARFTNSGMTLIEVMVSLVILTSAIGLSSGLVKKGIDYPFITTGVENWITFIEETENQILALPSQTNLNTIRTNMPPLNHITTPIDLRSWQITWEKCNLPNVKTVAFHATTIQGKTIEWRIYRTADE